MSGTLVGRLKVSLGLDSSRFDSGTRSVRSSLGQMKLQFMAVGGAALVLGTAISAAAMKGAADIDKVAKSARRVNSSIGGFRALEMAAGEAGVDVATLADAVQTMDRELAKGSKNAAGSLGQIGLAAADLDGLEADQKLALISDRIKELGLSSGQASAVLQGLGIRNKEMLLAVMSGGDAFRNARADVEDYGLALSSVDSDRIEVANDAIGRLGLIGQYAGQQLALAIVPALGAMAQAMTDSLREGGILRMVIDALANNIDVLGASISVAVTAFGVRYVGALAIAQLATFSFAGALGILKTALITTGIGAIVVGAGWLVAKFMDLVEATGSFGAAMGLLKDLVSQAWNRMGLYADTAMARMGAGWQGLKAIVLDGAQSIIDANYTMGNTIVGVFQGAFDAVKAIWGMLPGAIADFAYQAANGLIGGVESMLNAVVSRINTFIGGMNKALAMLPEWATGGGVSIGNVTPVDLGGIANPYAGKAGEAGVAAGAAFSAALGKEYAKAPNIFGSAADDARGKSSAYTEAANMLGSAASKPLPAWQVLKDAMFGTKTEVEGVAAATDDLSDSMDDLGGGSGGSGGGGKGGAALDTLTDKTKTLKSTMEDVRGTMQSAFSGLVTGAKSLNESISDVLGKFADMLANQAFDALWGGGSGGGGGLGGFFGNLFGIGKNANGTNNWRGGLTSVNERGGEIMNLPRGTQIIPNDISRRMASNSNSGGGGSQTVIRLELSPDIEARILQQSGAQTVQMVQTNNRNNARAQRRP